MKKLLLVLLILTDCKNEPEIISVEVYSVSHLIESPVSLRAKQFFSTFSGDKDLKRRTISSIDSIEYVAEVLKKMKPDSTCTALDARAVLLVNYTTYTDTVGGNYACVRYRGKNYEAPPELSRLFWGVSFKAPD